MTRKKRLLIANDASFFGSGYGVYGKELLNRLHKSGKYEVAELGCYVDENDPRMKNIPWKFYPNAPADPKEAEIYRQNPTNQFGAWRFNSVLLHFQPDIVFDIRDYWMYSYQETTPLRPFFKWVIMPTVDSAPQKVDWLFTFCNADVVVPYTRWAKNTLIDSCGKKINLFPKIANAGINPDELFPVDNKTELKIKYFGKNYDVIGMVMRNQKRKLLPDIFIAFRNYLNKLKSQNLSEKADNTILYMHTSFPEEMGWDLPSLLLEYGLLDKVYFTYLCRSCNKFCCSKYQETVSSCPYCNNKSACFTSVSNHVTTQQLNEVYNLFDLFVQYAICEGFGMPQIEAASCGVPIASVDYSAMTEIAENVGGFKIPVSRMFRELETGADRAYPDISYTTDLFYDFFVNKTPQDRENLSKTARNLCINQYTWDHTFQVWDECFDSIDISSNLDWAKTPLRKTNHQNVDVPANLAPKDFVNFIVHNVINEPSLLNSSFCQSLIKDATMGLVCRNNAIKVMTYQDIVQNLEVIMNTKIAIENARTNTNAIIKEKYVNAQSN